MINRFIYCVFLIISISSCMSKNKAPSEIIQPAKMKNIMWDVMRAQVLADEICKKDSSLNDTAETKALVQKIFEIHKIKSEDFDKSYYWYIKHPELLSLIFDSLYTQQQRNEKRLYNKHLNIPHSKKNILQWDEPYKLNTVHNDSSLIIFKGKYIHPE